MSYKITELTELSAADDNDVIPIVDVDASTTKKIKVSNLNISGKTSTQTSDYTITKDNEVVWASGNITITLPAASNAWKEKIINVGTGTVTIQVAGSDTIEGSTTVLLTSQYESIVLEANGGALWAEF